MSVLRNTAVVGAFTMLSRLLGLVREMLQSRLIGAGVEQSAFTLAFAVPNMFRKMFGEGALTAAFVPVFREMNEKEGLEAAARLARSVFAMVMLLLLAIVVAGVVALNSSAFFLGSSPSPRATLIVSLVTILLPYMLFICGAAFGMGVLNALGRFKASSFMPAFLNLVWIAALAVLAFFPGLEVRTRVSLVAGAILLGGFAQLVFMLVCMARSGVNVLRRGFLPRDDGRVRLVWRNLAIGIAGAGAVQANYALDQFLAQLASPWAAGVIGYAERLMDLPLGVVGVAFGTVLLPTFAGFFAKDDLEGARAAMGESVKNMMFVMLPAAAGLCVLAPEVTRLIYQGGSFDAQATVRVSRSLAVYAAGLGFFGFQKSLIPWFQAQKDMKTPLRVSVCTVVVNAVLNILAVWLLPVEWRHVGLAGSTTVCAAAGCALLLVLARRRNGSLGLSAALPYVAKTVLAALLMAAAIAAVRRFLCGNVYLLMAVGAVAYAALSLPLGIFRIPRRRIMV